MHKAEEISIFKENNLYHRRAKIDTMKWLPVNYYLRLNAEIQSIVVLQDFEMISHGLF